MKKEKSLPNLLNECQRLTNLYVKLRDLNGNDYFTCISCGAIKPARLGDASHYYSQGHYAGLRFDLDNIHLACQKCNRFEGGNLIGYTKALPLKIGEERFKLLEIRAGVYKRTGNKWSRFDVQYRIKELKQKIKELK